MTSADSSRFDAVCVGRCAVPLSPSRLASGSGCRAAAHANGWKSFFSRLHNTMVASNGTSQLQLQSASPIQHTCRVSFVRRVRADQQPCPIRMFAQRVMRLTFTALRWRRDQGKIVAFHALVAKCNGMQQA